MIFEVMLLFLLLHQKQHTPDGNMVNFHLPVRTENQAEEPEQEALPELNHPPVEADSFTMVSSDATWLLCLISYRVSVSLSVFRSLSV